MASLLGTGREGCLRDEMERGQRSRRGVAPWLPDRQQPWFRPPVPECVCVTEACGGLSVGRGPHQGAPRPGLCSEHRLAAPGRPQALLGSHGLSDTAGPGNRQQGQRDRHQGSGGMGASDWPPRGVCPLLNISNNGVHAEQNPSLDHARPLLEPGDVPVVQRVKFPGKRASIYLELTPEVWNFSL